MLIESYNLAIEVSTHSVEEFEYEVIAHLPVNISQVLPYLNATLKNGTYFTDGPVFSWRKGDHKIGFWPNRIAVDHLQSREQASAMIEELVRMINDVWNKRESIQPDDTTRDNLQPLELYKLLPRTNCKVCGESTCFSFALKLAAGHLELRQCGPVYSEEQYADKLKQLESLLLTKRTLL